MNIVAIGGGEIRQRETFTIDTFIRDLAGKSSPKLLFIPTASYDASGYCEIVTEVYEKELGCQVQNLKLMSSQLSPHEIEDQILTADIIYVGGGDTKTMLEVWKTHSVDRHLKQALETGTILSGISAGAICWHQYGHSDYEAFTDKPDWEYRLLPCLGFQQGAFCPHLDGENRFQHFESTLKNQNITGIGCDNNAAVWYQSDNQPKVITSTPEATVKVLTRQNSHALTRTYTHGQSLPV